MRNFILWLADASFRGAVVTMVVLIVRQLFRKTGISSKYVSLLWILPYLCLVLPWQIESDFSIWGMIPGYDRLLSEKTMMQDAEDLGMATDLSVDAVFVENHEYQHADVTQRPVIDKEMIANAGMSGEKEKFEGHMQYSMMKGILVIWITGVIALLVYAAFSCMRLKRKILCSQCEQSNIYYADDIRTPFVWGMVHPRIYLPSDMSKEHGKYVVEHEKTHIYRGDYIKKPVAFLISCIHWFNPFVWLAFYLLEKDMEMACDEETIQRIGLEKKQEYASVLLLMASGTKRFQWAGMPISFGEGDMKRRITNILKYKRTLSFVAMAAVVIVIVLACLLLTSPKNRVPLEQSQGDIMEEVSREQSQDDGVDEVLLEQNQGDAAGEIPREPGQVDADGEGVQKFILPEDAEMVEITVPVVTENTEPGADCPILDYASEEMLVFHDYYGLFVFNRERGMIGAVDLKAIGCHFTQGDHYCDVQVEQDGSKVYMHVLSREDMYVYDIVHNVLYRQPYDVSDIDFFNKIKETRDCVNPDYTVLRSEECAVIDNGYHYLESGSGMIIDLCWICEPYNSTDGDREYTSLFR